MIYCFIVFIQETIDLEKQLRVSHKQKEKGMHFKLGKNVLITEKPSVAMEFAKVLKINTKRQNGYMESENWIITWCVGHLVTMSYPEKYDEKLKFWRLDTLPFMPKEYKYEVISNVQNQFNIIKGILTREDVEVIYVATDSGREGEYIYRLVDQAIGVKGKEKRRVWIDSQTEEEINRGIKEAKELSEYDSLSNSAYLRAKEDYLIGINFSRLLSIIYGRRLAKELEEVTGHEIRVTVPGHFQRGGSPCAYDRFLCTRFGAAAARLIKNEQYGFMVALQNEKIVPVPLGEVAGKLKKVPVDSDIIEAPKEIGISFGD